MSQELNRFTRDNISSISKRWKKAVVDVFLPKTESVLSNSKFYVDINESQNNDSDSTNVSSDSTDQNLNEEREPLPSTSREITQTNKDGTMPFIDERTFTINGPLPTPKPRTKFNPSSNKRDRTSKNFKLDIEIEDNLMAKDLLIEELRAHLNVLSAENHALNVQTSEIAEELSKQVAENFNLIEENQYLRQENATFIEILRQKETQSPFLDCSICMVEKSQFAFYPCGHVCLCDNCVGSWQSNQTLCPVCRQRVEAIIRIYI